MDLKAKAESEFTLCIEMTTQSGLEIMRAKAMVTCISQFHEYGDTFCRAVGDLFSALQMDINEVFSLYVGKNALNQLRQDYGYSDDTYQKMWGELEDNEVLYDIVQTFYACTEIESVESLWKSIYDTLLVEYRKYCSAHF
jgi:hypothetical protein